MNGTIYKLRFDRGKGTNAREEFWALWSLLIYANKKCLSHFQVFGDSKIIIDWLL